MLLTTKFRPNNLVRSNVPLLDNTIARVAPSIFAPSAHESRSERYSYIATIDVLNGLRQEGFQPFMACQTRVRDTNKREYTKHMIRLRHASQITRAQANEIILVNSHDGSSSYQMLAGVFRFVCHNGLVCGDTVGDVRIPHKGNVVDRVIEGAYFILDRFQLVDEQRDAMRAITLNPSEQNAFAHAALALRYDLQQASAPITETQLLHPRRYEDQGSDLWTVFNRVQENLTKGGLHARTAHGRRSRTRPVTGVTQDIKLNRALWVLADEMRRLKA